jgi:tRNA threonylcarbamoyladenosine biosynthesis protein TsaB
MLLLSTDTSGRQGSIALARAGERAADRHDVEVIEVATLAGGMFSAQLVPQVAALLAKHGFSKKDIGGFAVASGPGSFTGLRVGLAAIKALAEILAKPIAAISLLEATALAGGVEGRVVAILDAGRGDVYVGEYRVEGDAVQLRGERLLGKEEALAEARGAKLVTSDQAFASSAQAAGLAITVIEPVNAGDIARFGWKKLQAGDTVAPEQLEANYIRRTDAEIFAKGSS